MSTIVILCIHIWDICLWLLGMSLGETAGSHKWSGSLMDHPKILDSWQLTVINHTDTKLLPEMS